MSRRTEVIELTPREMEDLVERGVRNATKELQEKIGDLEKELRGSRSTLTLAQAATYFSGRVSESTIKDYYIKGRRLPQDVEHALPARRVGNLYFVEREVLERWLMGRTTESDLYPWQRK